jgi:hypothetical protein
MTFQDYFAPRFGLGWLVALIVLILCIFLWFIGKPLSPAEVLGLIGALAFARLT